MRLQIKVDAIIDCPTNVPAILQIEAADRPGFQNVEAFNVTINPFPDQDPITFEDLYRNLCRRFELKQGENQIIYEATVEVPEGRHSELIAPIEISPLELPVDALHYLLPSRYCPSDKLLKLASDTFGYQKPGYARVLAICEWINGHVTYQYGTSDASTDVIETLIERRGVCRDFAHLAISLCRALNIPARYVSGYCLGLQPPDFHAFFQAYIDGRWVIFDATELQPRPALVMVAVGRDAADCAWCTIYGPGFTKSLQVDVSLVQS